MANKYSINNYDKYICLKINGMLWLIILFLLRPYLVTIISLVNRKDKTGLINMIYSDKMILWWGLLASVPVILVIYAWSNKKPDASSFVKMLWHRGRELLAAAAIFNVAVVFIPFWMGVTNRVQTIGWIQLTICLGIVAILYSSSYVRDCFSEFPKEVDAEGSGSS